MTKLLLEKPCHCRWEPYYDHAAKTYERQIHSCQQLGKVTLSVGHIDRAIETFNRLYPGHSVSIGFMPDDQCKGDDGEAAQAFTLFPDDGGKPEIWISDATPIHGIPDTLFHEFAHVVAGIEAGHGAEFEAVYERLWKEFDE